MPAYPTTFKSAYVTLTQILKQSVLAETAINNYQTICSVRVISQLLNYLNNYSLQPQCLRVECRVQIAYDIGIC